MCVHAQLYLIPGDSMDCSPPGSSLHGIFQARILEWVAISSIKLSFYPLELFFNLCLQLIWRVLLISIFHVNFFFYCFQVTMKGLYFQQSSTSEEVTFVFREGVRKMV